MFAKYSFFYRTDVAFCIILPSTVDGSWSLKSDTIRFCLNDVCYKTIAKAKLKNKRFHPLEELDISFLPLDLQQTVIDLFDGKNVNIVS